MPGWVAPALAGAAVGAAATYALTDHNGNSANNNGGYNNGNNGSFAGNNGTNVAPGYNGTAGYNAPQSSGGMGFFGTLVLLALLGGGGYMAYRAFQSKAVRKENDGYAYGSSGSNARNYASAAPIGLTSMALAPTAEETAFVKRFTAVQDLNNSGDISALAQVTTPEMLSVLAPDAGNSRTTVLSMTASVIDTTEETMQTVTSVRFTGSVTEDGDATREALDEVWHFVRKHGSDTWLLAGIEQV